MKIKMSKLNFALWVSAIVVLVLAILFAILNQFVFGAKISSILLLFTILFLGLGVVFTVESFFKKTRVAIFKSAIAIVIGYSILSIICGLLWWIIIVCDFFICVFYVFLSLIIVGNVTETVAETYEKEYKAYKERLALEEEAKKAAEKEEMPELKSYSKDEK